MESNYRSYDHLKSVDRIDQVIAESERAYEELDEIPPREKLTFTNGFYVYCSALFVDIRNSSSLPARYTRPKLAKLYRAYISETIAVMNGDVNGAEISVEGDCVFGVFNTRYKSGIDSVFSTAATVASLINTLNCKFRRNGIEEIRVGIGMSYGRALMIKAGYNGSGINDVVWMGDVLNDASKLCGFGNATYMDMQMMVSSVFYDNLNDHNKSLLKWNQHRGCYHGNVIDTVMDEWYKENCSQE